MDFTETLTIRLPNVGQQLAAFAESDYRSNHGLIVEIAAIHEGMTANMNFYSANELEKALQSWVSPYAKPVIMNHDPYTEPIGRVVAAKMDKEEDGVPFTKLQAAITDPEAIAKVMDKRYLTGSVGGKAGEAKCSVCGADWAQASLFEAPCKHRPGKTYKGKMAYLEMGDIAFKEYSIVNVPADQRSGIRTVAAAEQTVAEDDDWVRTARFFSLDMSKDEILEFAERDNRNVLEGLKKKDASPVYMQLKGAFLSALAVAESEKDDNPEESDVTTENLPVESDDDDVLTVAEALSSDLATSTEEVDGDGEEILEEEEVVSEEEEEEVVEEGERPEGQEHSRDQDIDPEDSSGAPVSRESEESTADDVVEEEASEEVELEEEDLEEEVSESELNEATTLRLEALELRVEEMTAREAALLEENARLKSALKRGLAERVVDMKIALGLFESDQRDTLLEEHVTRSASSLADSLRDLSAMPSVKPDYTKLPSVEESSGAVDSDEFESRVVTEGEGGADSNKTISPEDFFVDVLMGRESL